MTQNVRYPYWNGEHCVSCVAGSHAENRNMPYLNAAHTACIDDCPDDTPYLSPDNVCEPCPVETPIWTTDMRLRGGGLCKSCEEIYVGTRPYWSPHAQACLPECPAALAPVDGSKICRTCAEVSPEKPHWDIDAEECVLCPR